MNFYTVSLKFTFLDFLEHSAQYGKMRNSLSLKRFFHTVIIQLFAKLINPNFYLSGMILAVLFLVLVCVIVFLIKQNRGGKYPVQEREELHGRRDPYDDGGFPEFTQP